MARSDATPSAAPGDMKWMFDINGDLAPQFRRTPGNHTPPTVRIPVGPPTRPRSAAESPVGPPTRPRIRTTELDDAAAIRATVASPIYSLHDEMAASEAPAGLLMRTTELDRKAAIRTTVQENGRDRASSDSIVPSASSSSLSALSTSPMLSPASSSERANGQVYGGETLSNAEKTALLQKEVQAVFFFGTKDRNCRMVGCALRQLLDATRKLLDAMYRNDWDTYQSVACASHAGVSQM